MRLTSCKRFGACLLVLAACQSVPAQRDGLTLVFITEADPGVPLSGVSIRVDGVPIGTSLDGRVQAQIRASSKRTVRIGHDCPAGHRDPGEDTLLRVRPFEELGVAKARGMELTLRCPPQKHIAAFAVRALNAPPLPILMNGIEVARTSHLSVAHFSSRGVPGMEFIVRLDTSSDARLVPQHPTRVFTLDDEHQVFVIDQAFEVNRGPPRKRRRKIPITKIE